jgi:hypothetical protein
MTHSSHSTISHSNIDHCRNVETESTDVVGDSWDAREDPELESETGVETEFISPYSILPTDEEREIIIMDALTEVTEIMKEHALEYKREDFRDDTIEDLIDGYLCYHFSEIGAYRSNYSSSSIAEAEALNEVMDVYIREIADEVAERFYEDIAPPRAFSCSFTTTENITESSHIYKVTAKLEELRAKPQPVQRTDAWYARRNELITASAASKAFGTPASVNQLIYEKCKNYILPNTNTITTNTITNPDSAIDIDNDTDIVDNVAGHSSSSSSSSSINVPQQQHVSLNSPLHWGQRYEPITAALYEYRNKTKLGEFGCIQHDTYSFIGASPDGINIDPNSPLYGRMVEIKNIFNREITGTPKEEYWIQMQLQMEVCGLDECDFVETRIKEYNDEAEFNEDSSLSSFSHTSNGNEKGIILWFQPPAVKQVDANGTCSISYPMPLYEYAPIGATQEEYDAWEQEIFSKHEKTGCIWVRNIYWYVDQYSCVLVLRNRLWFEAAVPVLQSVWATIEKERKTGYAHRAPKRKPVANTAGSGGNDIRVIKLDLDFVPGHGNGSGHTMIHNKTSNSVMRPSDVLMKCFKIDDLELDETKIE